MARRRALLADTVSEEQELISISFEASLPSGIGLQLFNSSVQTDIALELTAVSRVGGQYGSFSVPVAARPH